MNSNRPNVVFILADQLRASSLPAYGCPEVNTPGFDRMQREGITCTNAVSTYPLCTPYRGMLMTGRHPHTTGVFVNFTSTRHDEIGLGDTFRHAGYATGYIGKWHLHRGAFPSKERCWIPEGRSRLGFDYWRAYNCHTTYFNGHVNKDDWNTEAWDGYETDGLLKYAEHFIDTNPDRPFFCLLSPHQPHATHAEYAPEEYYRLLPEQLTLPDNVNSQTKEELMNHYRNYMAMVLAVDAMVGNVLNMLEQKGILDKTIVVVSSDHGTQMGSHTESPTEGGAAWAKRRPYEESVHVPLFIRLPHAALAGEQRDALISPVDLYPTLCGLTGISVPRSVEGHNLADAVLGKEHAAEQEAVFMMNFSNFSYSPDWIRDSGNEWRGVRTKRYTYALWRDGHEELYDRASDPLQLNNVAPDQQFAARLGKLRDMLGQFMKRHKDDFPPYEYYRGWFDQERRIIRNAHGTLSHPESEPDWSLLS